MSDHKMKKHTKIAITGAGVLVLIGGIAAAGTHVMAGGWGHGGFTKHGMKAHAMDMFDRIDANGDAAIARAELDAFRDDLIASHDQDGNKAINLAEFESLLVSQMRPIIIDRFQDLDDDANGVITITEIDVKVNHLMRWLDRNGDDAIELREIRRGKHGYHDDDDDDDDDDRASLSIEPQELQTSQVAFLDDFFEDDDDDDHDEAEADDVDDLDEPQAESTNKA